VHAVPADFSPLWADPAFLRDIQYADDRNLAARQSIYAHQYPRQDLPSLVMDSLALAGRETVVDVGCGNGLYLAGLASRGHRGPVTGPAAALRLLRRSDPVRDWQRSLLDEWTFHPGKQ
jgi:hypothetical protein